MAPSPPDLPLEAPGWGRQSLDTRHPHPLPSCQARKERLSQLAGVGGRHQGESMEGFLEKEAFELSFKGEWKLAGRTNIPGRGACMGKAMGCERSSVRGNCARRRRE